MKKLVALSVLFALFSISVNSQNNDLNRLLDAVEIAKLGSQHNNEYHNIEGSPYSSLTFSAAKIYNVANSLPMRYNIYDDVFEFIGTQNDTLILQKSELFQTITFVNFNVKYQLLNYTSNKGKTNTGYLINVYEKNEYVIFKKQNVDFVKEKIATTSFDRSSPAKFLEAKDTYYLKNNDKGVLEFPTNKKNMIKLFIDKKNELEVFFKENDINFSKESDLRKIIDFLAL